MNEPCPFCSAINEPGISVCGTCGGALTIGSSEPTPETLPVGTPLKDGEYRIGRLLGQGGFGITYLGSQQSLKRPVALKEFFPAGCLRQVLNVRTDGNMTAEAYQLTRERFLEEARILARFQHPGIVEVYDSFEENGTAYMAMEYLPGKTLEAVMKERNGRLPEAEAVQYIEQVAEALREVHRENLLHRDLKPENLVLTGDGRVVMIDFGSARVFAAGQTMRMTGLVTHGYAPLEQYGQQARYGPYTDLYSLGATLYHLLTGEIPIPATDRAMGADLTSIRKIQRGISEGVEAAVMAALQVMVAQRPQTVEAWLALLRNPQPSAPKTGKILINPRDKAEMVYVPAGEFTMGGNDHSDDEKPAHKVRLDGYWIYKTTVTVAQYRMFCAATGRSMPKTPSWGWKENHPIVRVTWNDAAAYSNWAGDAYSQKGVVRLPTEAEWEKAARGTDGRIYPWGDTFDQSRLQCSKEKGGDAGSTAPVGSFPTGASPYGALDMAGNVWEWVADWYDASYYKNSPNANPKGPGSGTKRVLRGGSWDINAPSDFRAAGRSRDYPELRYYIYGFRCVAGLPAPSSL